MVMLRSYMCPKLTIYIYILIFFLHIFPLSSACIGGTTVIIGCPPHISCGQSPGRWVIKKRLDTVKETLAAEGVKGHSRFYGRVTKNWLTPQGLENFLEAKTAVPWLENDGIYALFNSIGNIFLEGCQVLGWN